MKALVQRVAGTFGYEISRRRSVTIATFRSDDYVRGDMRRLEHLASLGIGVRGKTVLEVGAGIGDHSTYYLDRGCRPTITDARDVNVEILRRRFPHERVLSVDLDNPASIDGAPFDVVHCYGTLYHLSKPAEALAFLADSCAGILFLETCVSFGSEPVINPVNEVQADASQSVSGLGCRPTRAWVFRELQRHFAHAYCTKTQPNHEEFPLDWTAAEKHGSRSGLQRAVFVASRSELPNDCLSTSLPAHQVRHE